MRLPDFFMGRGPLSSGPNLAEFSGVVLSVTGVGLSPAVPAGPSRRVIRKGDLVVVDIPTLVEGYHADQSRTYCVGKADNQIRDLYKNLKMIADRVLANLAPGVKCSELFHLAMDQAAKLKVSDAFLNFGNNRKSHMVGHGVGLECSEPPVISATNHVELEENYVMALEIHMYREKVGVVKLEDMLLITHNGAELLSKSPRQLLELGAYASPRR